MVKGFLLIQKPDRVCNVYIFGKKHRESFPVRKIKITSAPLEIVHSNLCGPMQTNSIRGYSYFMTFIDDYTRKTWVYFLRKKSDAFDIFQRFKDFVEKQSGYYIKVLRIDREGEYVSNAFMNFYKYQIIMMQNLYLSIIN